MDVTVRDAALITGGHLVAPDGGPGDDADASRVARGFSFDSRTLVPGEAFVALHDLRDGHDFVADAFGRGAAFALVERVPARADGPCVVVGETTTALIELARAARARLQATVVAVTGSAGKTSTKDLAAAALAAGMSTHASRASFNNEIGLPVTLLDAPEDAEAVVLEMGARFAGNISELCEIASPSIGVITHIGLAHAEHLGGRGGIARVKGELLDALPAEGLAILNADCEHSLAQRHRTVAPVITVGTTASADVSVGGLEVDHELHPSFRLDSPWGSARIRLALRGAHQALNGAQAATVALHLGVPLDAVVAALANASSADRRMQLARSPYGVTVLDDSYNASPGAMTAALEALAHLPVTGRRIAVLGEMRELGAAGPAEHARIGAAALAEGIDVLVVVGAAGESIAAGAIDGDVDSPIGDGGAGGRVEIHQVADAAGAATLLEALVAPGDAVLVKASRAVGLERVVMALLGTQTGAVS
ncbi:MAG: UDP-N-acetylmuramoyl-tripeptide--D-alanyl-D-alanine ligase [Actinobacteria bacterium]|nr:UDP-N-acetylmuramoyl-tripeptide--D-alanyl-D-alanine ligase [Actinomycetota bacterium]